MGIIGVLFMPPSMLIQHGVHLCPVKTFHIKRDRPPWFSDDITELSKHRNDFFRLGRKNKDQFLLGEARYLRTTIKRDLPKLKNDYYLHLMTSNQDNIKKFWTTMNDIICSKNKSDISIIKHPDTNLLLNTTESVEVLNHYFVNVADTLVKKLPLTNDVDPLTTDILNSNTVLKFDNCITPEKVKQTLKDFLPTKSSGCLKISSRIYLDSFEILHEQLAFIMNLSLRTSKFPTAWKKSIVTLIPKKGDCCIVGNIRPISLIHICSKLLEKIVSELLIEYLQRNTIVKPSQYGFVKNRSTTDCIAALCNDLFHNINKNVLTGCLFLDYSKAFDCVNHSILIYIICV